MFSSHDELIKVFLHQKIGLRIRTELENMSADFVKTVSFIKRLRPRIKFPNAEPHYIAMVLPRDFETFVHQVSRRHLCLKISGANKVG